MSYQPIIPVSGYNGWQILSRTKENQQDAFNGSADITRELTYFAENIGKITTAEELVGDYQLLKVALGAYGLDEDIDSKFFLKEVLSEGTGDDSDLANKLTDKRYETLAAAFAFDGEDGPASTIDTEALIAEVSKNYQERQFEIAVGEQDESMRLAMSLDRDLTELMDKDTTDDGRWFAVMGNPQLRQVFDTAIGLPKELAMLDLDTQLVQLRDKSEQFFDAPEVTDFSDPEKMDKLLRYYVIRAEINGENTGSANKGQSLALSILQGSPQGAASINLMDILYGA
jgi:uncharacterized protein DUF1217